MDKHIRRLDADLAKFENEMKEKGRLSQTETEDSDEDDADEEEDAKDAKKKKGRKAGTAAGKAMGFFVKESIVSILVFLQPTRRARGKATRRWRTRRRARRRAGRRATPPRPRATPPPRPRPTSSLLSASRRRSSTCRSIPTSPLTASANRYKNCFFVSLEPSLNLVSLPSRFHTAR